MSPPVTTLQQIITLAHQQYGIRFQLSKQQLVDFANMIQYIAYNQDSDAFVVWDQMVVLGIDTLLETDPSYISPLDTDIGKDVSGSINGVKGTLINFETRNRANKWIIAPPDGTSDVIFADQEILTIVGGSPATGVAVNGQNFFVSSGPYRVPSMALGNPPFRKYIGITQTTDKQMFEVPPNNGFDGPDDYGLLLNSQPGRRQNFPFRYNIKKQEVQLVASTPPEITQTDELLGPGGTQLNTSKFRWIYWFNPPPILTINDEASVILPEEYRYEILYTGISRLADTATYGDSGSIRQLIEPLCKRFWEDMRDQYQQMGRGSDWVSHGDQWDWYGLGLQGPWGNAGWNRGQSWYTSA